MNPYYAINTSEQNELKIHPLLLDGEEYLQALFAQLPERVIKHSERVCLLSGVIAGYLPKEQLPVFLSRERYVAAVSYGAYYHEIGIYNAGNRVCKRPAASGDLLARHGLKDFTPAIYVDVALETARSCQEYYNGEGFPDGLKGEDIPIHAAICGIADAVDMILSCKELTEKNVTHAVEYFAFNYGRYLLHPGALQCFEQTQDEIIGLYVNDGWSSLAPSLDKKKKRKRDTFDVRAYLVVA